LQAASHPDFHAHAAADPADRRRAEGASALINEAFRTLANPLLRAQYLLREQFGVDLAGDEAGSIVGVGEDVLDVVLEAREVIEEAESEEELVGLREENEERIRRAEEVIGRLFGEGDLEGLKREVVRLRYWVNIRESVDNWERGKGVVLEH
jgi:molecular chaperone HscB